MKIGNSRCKNLSRHRRAPHKAETQVSQSSSAYGPIVSPTPLSVARNGCHQVEPGQSTASHDRIYKAPRQWPTTCTWPSNDAATAIEQQAKKEKTKRLAGPLQQGCRPPPEAPAEEGIGRGESRGPGQACP